MSAEEARALGAGNPRSFVHVIRPEVDLPEGMSPYDERVYEKAASNFASFQAQGWLVRAPGRSVYLYQQALGSHRQQGFVVCCHIEDYERNVILKHEKTRQATEDDRVRHVSALGANAGPVFLTCRDDEALARLAASASAAPPLYDFEAGDGVRHTVWEIPGGEQVVEAFSQIPRAYVADGHHRSASAARVGAQRRDANPHHTGDEEYNWFLSVVFPASQLKVMAYNRCVEDLGGKTPEAFLAAVGKRFRVTPGANPVPESSGRVSMYLDGAWYDVAWPGVDTSDPVAGLDVAVLQDQLLVPVLGVGDPRKDPRMQFVGGVRGVTELERRVDAGTARVAFSMYPTSIHQLMDVADAGLVMPPKSTWFEPKLRSGLLVHTLD
jgi:uncharacterized protein (DUF1015 family)